MEVSETEVKRPVLAVEEQENTDTALLESLGVFSEAKDEQKKVEVEESGVGQLNLYFEEKEVKFDDVKEDKSTGRSFFNTSSSTMHFNTLKRDTYMDNISDNMLDEIKESSEFKLRNQSYTMRIVCALSLIFGLLVLIFIASEYPLVVTACSTLFMLSILGLYCAFSYHESLLLVFLILFGIWIIAWALVAILSLTLSSSSSGISAIAESRCSVDSIASEYPTDCVAQVQTRLMITGLILCGAVGSIFSLAWKYCLDFYLFVVRLYESRNEDGEEENEEVAEEEPTDIKS